MKTFSTSIPSNNNAAGSGSPYSDVVKTVNALVEIRSFVPSDHTDIGAGSVPAFNTLLSQVEALEKSVIAFGGSGPSTPPAPVDPNAPMTQSTNPTTAALTAKSRSSAYQIPAGKTGFEHVGWDRLGLPLRIHSGNYTVDPTTPRDSEGWITLEGLDIRGRFSVPEGLTKVRLKRSRVAYGGDRKVEALGSNADILLEDCEIDGLSGQGERGFNGSNVTMRRTWIHHCVDAIRASWNIDLDTCLISDMRENDAQNHNDCLQSTSSNGTDPTSTVACSITSTSFVGINDNGTTPSNAAIILKPDTGGIQNWTFTNCFFSGGNYSVYIANSQTNRPIRNIRFVNSVFGGRAKYGDIALPGTTVDQSIIAEWTNTTKADGSAFSCLHYQVGGGTSSPSRTAAQMQTRYNS